MRVKRESLLGHKGAVLWLTGLPGAGKSTLAAGLEQRLLDRRILAAVIDGDVLRAGLSRDLGFTPEGRRENIRRATEVALHLAEAGLVAIVALISPLSADRETAAARVRGRGVRFSEVFVNAPLAVCEQRDPKGHYKRARAGEIAAFTGINAPYEAPLAPEFELHTDTESIEESLDRLAPFAASLVALP